MAEEQQRVTDIMAIAAMFDVGMPAICYPESSPSDHFHKAFLRGWHPGGYLIMEVLYSDERKLSVTPGETSQFKFRRDGDTWTFQASIIDSWTVLGDHHVRYSWPEHVEQVRVRKHDRVDAILPCNVIGEEGTWVKGQIRDLGAGGCRLIVKTPPEAGSNLHLSFTLPDGTTIEDVQTVVRSIAPLGQGAALGCQFADGTTDAARQVELFVATHIEQTRAAARNTRRVLVIERNSKIASHLRRSLENRGFDVAIAGGLVDGFSVLKSLTPTAVMVNIEQSQLPGTEVCRIVRNTPEYRNLPVFIYGRDDEEHERRAMDAGASGYLPYILSANKIVDGAFGESEDA